MPEGTSWSLWSEVADNFETWISQPAPTLRRVPAKLTSRFARCTKKVCDAVFSAASEKEAVNAFLLLLAHHRLLLAALVASRKRTVPFRHSRWDRLRDQTAVVKQRLYLFESGDWEPLLQGLADYPRPAVRRHESEDESYLATLRRALQLTRTGELRRAVQRLSSKGLAKGTPEQVLAALQSKFVTGEACSQGTAVDVAF